METKRHNAVMLPLWDCMGVMVAGSTWEKDTLLLAPSAVQEEEFKKRTAKKKRLQRYAEVLERDNDKEEMKAFGRRCNAALRHLATFLTLIQYSKDEGLKCGLSMFRKCLKEPWVSKEWDFIRRWVARQAKDYDNLAIALTIGRSNKGWYSLRCLAVGNDEEVTPFVFSLWRYLVKKRQWKNKAIRIEEDSSRLFKYYQSRDLDTYTDELFEVFRTSLMLHHRTFKNHKAVEILENKAVAIENDYLVSARHLNYNSPSGVALCSFVTCDDEIEDIFPVVNYSNEDELEDLDGIDN
ncbi:hypothetical protein [Dialister succinatiphilus]|uniref:hypothetical protein n=1 Tax=Dialister succinatiphilus TaxID=487173 RepID=UPI003FEDCBAF